MGKPANMNWLKKTKVADDFYDKIKPRLHQRIGRELRPAKRVLDIGCGACDLVKHLADTCGQKVIGVDISSRGLSLGRHSRGATRFRCLKRDAAKLGFLEDGSVGAVVMMWALHEMKDPHAILAEARRVLRPGGALLIVDFPAGSSAQRLWGENYYRPAEVRCLLEETGFSDVRVQLAEQGQVLWARGYQPQEQAI